MMSLWLRLFEPMASITVWSFASIDWGGSVLLAGTASAVGFHRGTSKFRTRTGSTGSWSQWCEHSQQTHTSWWGPGKAGSWRPGLEPTMGSLVT